MSVFKLVIPNWHPPSLNLLLSRHPMTRSRLKRVSENMVIGYALRDRIPIATGPRKVGLKITLGPRQRACDPDNYWKVLLDNLVKARLLINDDRQHAIHGAVEFERGLQRGTVITLTELGEGEP